MIRGLFLALALLAASTAAGAQTLVRDGHATARIYLAPNAGEPVELAARELNHHLAKMSGAALKVVRTADPKAVKAPGIVLGDLAVGMGAVPQKPSPGREGFRLLSRDGLMLVGGESGEGTLFGAYALLGKLGVDWVMPGAIGEIVPHSPTVVLPALDESQRPDFPMRRLWYRGGARIVTAQDRARMDQWLRRQRRSVFRPVAADTAGHSWPAFIRKHKAAFDADPTMYALVPGKDGVLVRRGPQVETTHPQVAALMAQDIRDKFAARGWPKDREAGFPIGPADGGGFSVSPESQAAGAGVIDPLTGEPDQTDLLVRLGDAVLEQLGPEYPNVYVGFYSYALHGGYPQRYRPHPRLAQVFAPITASRWHSMLDPSSRTQARYRSVFDRWAALSREQGNPLLYRGYNWNLAENMLPYSKLRIWGEELPYYRDAGVSGLNVEATKAWGVNGPSDWLFMKLAWDASQDWKALLADYCARSFGEGAGPMRRYLLRLTETQRAAGQEAGSYHAIHLIFDRAFVAAARADLAEATQLAKLPEERERIGYFAASIDLLDLYLSYHEAAVRFDFPAARTAYDAMQARWQAAYDQNPDVVAREAPQYLERFIGPFVREAGRFSSGERRLVAPLPDAMETAFGETPAAWTTTRTYSTTWDAQGLSGRPNAPVWYRHRFTLPPGLEGQPIGLFLGSFSDEARVWINGRALGTSGRRFSAPTTFDLTPGIDYAGENLVTIEVVRNWALSENGVGGLFRPSFIFAGSARAAEGKAAAPTDEPVR